MTGLAPAPAAPSAAFDVDQLRAREFAWMTRATGVYVNAASVGPQPDRCRAVADEWALVRSEPHRIGVPQLRGAADGARGNFARLIGADADEIALMTNTTYGLNFAARSLPMRAGGAVLTFDGEFPSCVYPFMAAARDRGLRFELIPKAGRLPDEDALVHAIETRDDVSAVVVSWVQFATGFVADLARIGAACRARAIPFIVDAIQGVGVRTLDVHALPIDVLSCGAQKWLCSPWGTGFVYVRRALVEQLEPHDVGWACMRSSDDYTRLVDYEYDFYPDARRFEVVTLPYQDIAVAKAATDVLLEAGVGAMAAHVAGLVDRLIAWAASRSDVTLVSPADAARRAGIVAFAPRDLDGMHRALSAAGVAHVVREGCVRLSPHGYNTLEEMERIVAVLGG
ncbi:MAG: aminotransferase class V-fold PLP-dependent enzyme [Gemmatimonadaceae bacterium]|jgi:selenocysteine lyase/cysteine desulfurase|nr:aminotransferase class V-fold PLP-dependent enzyme [Gemmatimonadaceae bacterium]